MTATATTSFIDIDFSHALGAAVVVLVILAAIYHDRPAFTPARPEIPQLKPTWPLLGALPYMAGLRKRGIRMLDEFVRQQREVGTGGRPYSITAPGSFWGGRVYVVNQPAYIRTIQKDEFDTWIKGEVVSHLVGDFLGFAGIFSTDGPVWYHQRKLASHIFARANFRSQIQAAVLGDVGKLDNLCNNVVSENARVNLPDIFHRFTLEAFVKMAFGVDLDILPEHHQGLEHTHAFATSFDFAQSYIERRPLSLIPMWAEVFTEDGRKYRRCARFVNEFSTKLIDERYAAVDGKIEGASAATKSGKDLLQLFLDSGVPREDLPSVILNFIIAGRDTTAQALSWFCWEMHQHPDVLERVRQEVWSVLGRQPQRDLEFDDHKELPYTQAALYESIRLHPAVPLSRRRAARDTVLKPNYDEATIESTKLPSLPVKKGQAVQFSDYVIARTPEVWGPDCEEYKPERFLSDQGQFKQPSQYKYRVFNSGPRLCLGQTLATYEAMAVISRLFGNFELVWDSDIASKPPTFLPALTHPCTPYYVSMRPLSA